MRCLRLLASRRLRLRSLRLHVQRLSSRHLSFAIGRMREGFDSETRLSGLIGAMAFTHSAGYFVTFTTGNTERAGLGSFAINPGSL